MLGILQILLGSTTSLLFYVSDICTCNSLKYVCKNVPKMQEPIKILGTRGVNTKQVPHCGPINIMCPGTEYFVPTTRLAGFVHRCNPVIIFIFFTKVMFANLVDPHH